MPHPMEPLGQSGGRRCDSALSRLCARLSRGCIRGMEDHNRPKKSRGAVDEIKGRITSKTRRSQIKVDEVCPPPSKKKRSSNLSSFS